MEVKSVGTFSVILVKLATPPLPSQPKQSWIWAPWVKMSPFVDLTIAGRWGELGLGGGGGVWRGMNPKPIKKFYLILNF